jgi:hypothetical protein
MARSRNLKPGFFKNEDLADIGPHAQLLFAGLWTIADKKGRLDDRPRRIKAELFPFYEVDVDGLLSSLSDTGFIQRYERDGNKYIQINNFDKHQNPHIKEAESTIPAPCKHSASTGKSGTSPADSLNPITLTLNPISDDFINQEFEKFWSVYPKREGSNPKKTALASFTKHLKKGTDPELIIRGARAYADECRSISEKKFVAQAATWLNQERWDDIYAKSVNRDHLGAK